jgi:type IV pilus assembly protein PilC
VIVYAWKGRLPGGPVQTGELKATSLDEAVAQLRRRRIIALQVRPKAQPGGGLRLRLRLRGPSVKGKDLAVFTRQFSTMVNAGLPLVQCLDILSRQTENLHFRRLISRVTTNVEGGATLAEALGKSPEAFDSLFVNMVSAGEAGGILDEILMRLATHIEKAEALRRKVKSAMTYPAVVFVVASLASLFMLLFIIPVFGRIFADFGSQLPLPTRIVVGLSELIQHAWWAFGAIIAGAIFILRRYYRTSGGRRRIDAFMLRAPLFGDILRKAAIARFSRTLGTLISSGVPLLTGLDVTARTAGNRVLEDAVMATKASIREGETFAGPLRESRVFPPMVVQMIAVGEETGALDAMLEKIASFYDEEVTTAVDSLTSIIEPVLMVFMGGMVGGMVIAMYLPMFKLVNVVAGGH